MNELPELNEALLDSAGLDELTSDIVTHTEILEVIVKNPGQRYAQEQSPSLDTGVESLKSGQAAGLQIRYRYEDAQWWDTIMATSDGFRLVRIRHVGM